MMSTKKLLQAAAGAAGGEALNVEEVFSTYLYEGNGSTQTITNGIDLDGEGGLVWIKNRDYTSDHVLYDTERGISTKLVTNSTAAENFASGQGITSFNSDGFTLTTGDNDYNASASYASWTFRKAPKFFDVVTYTGDGVAGREIAHNLGTTVGTLIVKRTDGTGDWKTWHRSLSSTQHIKLNSTAAATTLNTAAFFGDDTSVIAPTDSVFTIGSSSPVNLSGATYVAYLFAHNDGDGEFGPDADQDIIKCGSMSAYGTGEVSLGFEPQWILIKNINDNGNWFIFDAMRGMTASGSNDTYLIANNSNAEVGSSEYIEVNPDGFVYSNAQYYNGVAYIAIRRGPMAVPTDATEVFDINTAGNPSTDPSFTSGFVTDMSFNKFTTFATATYIQSRLQGAKYLFANTTAAESTASSRTWDYMDGWGNSQGTDTRNHSWMWRRAPNFFDVVAYTGNGDPLHAINHNLGVAPEMIWAKVRDTSVKWAVYHKGLGNTKVLTLNEDSGSVTDADWANRTPTATQFFVGAESESNGGGNTIIAYLFASLDGVSKVGSYTGNGTSQTIDCGFSSGARFVMIKEDGLGSWYVFDTERGIVAGNDPWLELDTTNTQNTSYDPIDPHSSGFTVNYANGNINGNGNTYIFYAIA